MVILPGFEPAENPTFSTESVKNSHSMFLPRQMNPASVNTGSGVPKKVIGCQPVYRYIAPEFWKPY